MSVVLKGRVLINTEGVVGLVSDLQKRNVTLAGAKAAAKVLTKAVRARTPVRRGSGMLKKSQGSLSKKGKNGLTSSYAVQGARKNFDQTIKLPGRIKPLRVAPKFYEHLVQFGTRPHRTGKDEELSRVRSRKVSNVVTRKKERFFYTTAATKQTTGKLHPGTKAKPFRLPAWQAVSGEAGAAAVKAMGVALEKEMAKAAKKAAAKAGK